MLNVYADVYTTYMMTVYTDVYAMYMLNIYAMYTGKVICMCTEFHFITCNDCSGQGLVIRYEGCLLKTLLNLEVYPISNRIFSTAASDSNY